MAGAFLLWNAAGQPWAMFALRAASLAGIALLWKAVARVQVADQEGQKQRGLTASDVSPFCLPASCCICLLEECCLTLRGCRACVALQHTATETAMYAHLLLPLVFFGPVFLTCIHQAAASRRLYLQHALSLFCWCPSGWHHHHRVERAEALLPGALISISAPAEPQKPPPDI